MNYSLWKALAACADPKVDTEIFFVSAPPESGKGVRSFLERPAKAVCAGCHVRQDCLDYALRNRIEEGVWGGMNELERKTEARRRHRVELMKRMRVQSR